METTDISTFSEYGLAGLMLGVCFAFIFYIVRQHKEERTEWRTDAREDRRIHEERAEKRDEKMSKALNELTLAVNAIKGN